MGAYSKQLVDTLNELGKEWKNKIEHAVTDLLSKPQYKNTGASLDTLKVILIEGNESKAPELHIEFDDSLNIINLRGLQWTKQPPAEDFTQWAETRTLNGVVPGYKNGVAPDLPPWKIQQRKVWAIIMSKKKFDTWKPKPWRKKSLGSLLKELNEQMLKSFDQAIQRDFEEAIKKSK